MTHVTLTTLNADAAEATPFVYSFAYGSQAALVVEALLAAVTRTKMINMRNPIERVGAKASLRRVAVIPILLLSAASAWAAPPTANPATISGTPEVGQTLTGNYNYNDADGDLEGATTFIWRRGLTAIPGATGQTYTLVQADQGQLIRFQVTPVAQTGLPGELVGPSAFATVGPVAPANTAPRAENVQISGTTEVGFTLTGSYSYVDDDGDAESGTTVRWLRGNAPIPGATGTSYTLVAADEGRLVRFEVTPRAAQGPSPGTPVRATVGPIAAANTPPTAGNVAISGTAEVGFTLTGSYDYGDADGDNEGSSIYRWYRNNSVIPGAGGLAYTLVEADAGNLIRFEVTPLAQSGVSPGVPVRSGPVGPVAPANTPPRAENVQVSGTAEVGFTLTGSYAYVDADNDAEGGSTYRWLRGNAVIPGSNGTSYTLVEADEGAVISFEVTPVAVSGIPMGLPVRSGPVGPVIPANTPPTANNVRIVAPSGVDSLVGQTLTGAYDYNDADGDLEGASRYRWLRDGAAIAGATSVSYVVQSADLETSLRFEVTPIAQTRETDGDPVQSAPLTISNAAPSITGQAALSTQEDTPLLITLAAFEAFIVDPDTPDGPFTLEVLDGVNYSRSGNTITPDQDFTGDLTVNVVVNDGSTNSDSFPAVVTVEPVNDAPVILSQVPAPLQTDEDASLAISLADNLVVQDPDNTFPDDFTLALLDGANYTVAANIVTPAENYNGPLSVGATVTDAGGLTSNVFQVQIEVASVNDQPSLVSEIVDQNAIENSAYTLDVSGNFADDDGDTLTFAATWSPQQPPNIDFDPVTGVFSGTPDLVDTEEPGPVYDVLVTATDGAGGLVTDAFVLTVLALDRANLALSVEVAPDTATPGDQFRWSFTTTNPVGPQPGADVELNGTFVGAGLTVVPGAGSTCTITPGASDEVSFTCSVGALPVGASITTVLETTTSAATDVLTFARSASINSLPIDPNPADNEVVRAAGVGDEFSIGSLADLGSLSVRSLAAGDLNGDGRADVVAGTAAGQPVQVYLAGEPNENCGCMRDFLPVPLSIPADGENTGLALADFDNNGSIDLVVANGGGQPDLVFLNDGLGNFAAGATLDASFAEDVVAADFNADGNVDIAFAAVGGNPVYLGDGLGGFVLEGLLGAEESQSVGVARLDGDSLPDLVFGNVGSPSRTWLRSATGFVTGALLNVGDAGSVAAADLDGNGSLDLVFARRSSGLGDVPANPVLLNDGSGNFNNQLGTFGASPTSDVKVGDFNRDGSPDLLFINDSGLHQIWIAAGGSFSLYRQQIIDVGASAAFLAPLGEIAAGDEGGVDLILGGAVGAGIGVFVNDGNGNLGRGDAVPPELTLVGEATVSIPAGGSYSDAGATAVDNIDGDLTANIIVENNVNASVVGNYTVTYSVADFAGNAANPISRTVIVEPAAGTGGGGGGSTSLVTIAALIALLLLTRPGGGNQALMGRHARMGDKWMIHEFMPAQKKAGRVRSSTLMSFLVVALLSGWSGTASAQAARYSWFEVGYNLQQIEREGLDINPITNQSVALSTSDGTGVQFRGSLGTLAGFYAFIDYSTSDPNVDALVTNPQGDEFSASDVFDLAQVRGGGGYVFSLFEKTDIVAEVSYDVFTMDFGSFAGEDFDLDDAGLGAKLGIRSIFADDFELRASARYTSVGDPDLNERVVEADVLFGVGAGWTLIRGLTLSVDAEFGEVRSVSLGFRLDLDED